jgi:hypothetical protein
MVLKPLLSEEKQTLLLYINMHSIVLTIEMIILNFRLLLLRFTFVNLSTMEDVAVVSCVGTPVTGCC